MAAAAAATGETAREAGRNAAVVAIALALVALSLLLLRSWRIDQPYSIDFATYWLAGSRVAAGEAERLYEAGGGPAAGLPRELPQREFKNLPLLAVPFAPLAALDFLTAKRVFWWIDLAALAATAALLGLAVLPSGWGRAPTRVAGCLALLCFFAPAHTALRHGQTTPLVALAVTAFAAAALRGHRVAAGAALAAGALVKWPVLAVAGAEALRRRWRALVVTAAGLAAAAVLSVAIFGAGLHATYLQEVTSHAGTVMTGHNNQSAAVVLARLVAPTDTLDWTPRRAGTGVVLAATVAAVALLAWAAVGIGARPHGVADEPGTGADRRLLEWPAALAAGVVALPVAWDHYFLLLAPGVAMLAAGLAARGLLARPAVRVLLATAVLLLALPTPQPVIENGGRWGVAGALILSHYFLGAVLVLGLSVHGLRQVRR